MMHRIVLAAVLLLATTAAHGQTPKKIELRCVKGCADVAAPGDPILVIDGVPVAKLPPPAPDPLADAFFPPELVMQHRQKLGLTGAQRSAIVQEMQQAQPRFVELQWQLQSELETLSQLVRVARPDEARVLQQLDRVLELERQTKRTQIELLLRIKSTLTEAQQQALAALARRPEPPSRER